MKKIIIGIFPALIFLSVSIPLQAQNNEMSRPVSVLPESDNLNGRRNYFSIGWTNQFSHFTINKKNYAESNEYFLSPGFELQLSYHINKNLKITSGISNQLFHYKTPVPNQDYPPNEINTVHLSDLGFPFLLNIKLIDLNSKSKISLTSGLYFWKPIYAEYTSNYKIWGGNWSLCQKYNLYDIRKLSFFICRYRNIPYYFCKVFFIYRTFYQLSVN